MVTDIQTYSARYLNYGTCLQQLDVPLYLLIYLLSLVSFYEISSFYTPSLTLLTHITQSTMKIKVIIEYKLFYSSTILLVHDTFNYFFNLFLCAIIIE